MKGKGEKLGNLVKETCWFTTLVFIALRACGVINWNWYWLLSPILGLWIIAILLLALCAVAMNSTKED